MNFQKNIFLNEWEKKIKKSKSVIGIKEHPTEIIIWFTKLNGKLHKKIKEWLVNNDYEFQDINHPQGFPLISIQCPF